MATVKDMLDALASGQASLEQTAARFRTHQWSLPARADDDIAAMWGQADDELPGENTWGVVDADSRLSPAQYQVLADAYEQALPS